ncbi:hypothetical protein PspLS_00618 [Pyricularia sp. CBS 133598]|nr:hypothetical protein PspLS_00618 [Pyricularia sp. CBS 133598]
MIRRRSGVRRPPSSSMAATLGDPGGDGYRSSSSPNDAASSCWPLPLLISEAQRRSFHVARPAVPVKRDPQRGAGDLETSKKISRTGRSVGPCVDLPISDQARMDPT